MDKKRVAVIFGGASSEHEVSCVSAAYILNNIDKNLFTPIPIGITKSGEWFLFFGSIEDIKNHIWEQNPTNKKAFISPDAKENKIVVLEENGYKTLTIDIVFPVLHGKNGEDGAIQGLFQMANLPFVGCNMNSSSACMDKIISNILFKEAGINQAKFTWVYDYEIEENIEKCVKKVKDNIGLFPVFVKPSSAGSSVGVSKALNSVELKKAFLKAKKEDNKILIEEAISGIEAECAVLGNKNDLFASTVGQIKPANDFYDYEAKYKNDNSKLYIPAKLKDDVIEKIKEIAKKAYRTLGCAGLSRVDFFVDKYDNIYLNEINTLPGFTSISMYPKLMEYSGYDIKKLITKLIELAENR